MKKLSLIRPSSLDSFALEQVQPPQPIVSSLEGTMRSTTVQATPARHVAAEENSQVGMQPRSGFQLVKSKFMAAKPSLLAPLLPPSTPVGATEQSSQGQPVPQTTKGCLQLPISPFGLGAPTSDYQQVTRQNMLTLAPMTPQMGGNIAFQRRQPVKECPDQTVSNERFGVCIRKSSYRKDQEDRFMVRENFKGASYNGCFAVFDGHGGQRAAEFARNRLSLILDQHPEIESNVVGSLNQVFKQVDDEFLQIARQDCSPDGSTCLLGVVLNGRLTVANIGDSIATLTRRDGSWVQVNSEHTPCRQDERLRIENANGSVFHNRINGELSVSRAFGDYEMKDLIIAEPECRSQMLTHDDDLLILASDGIHRSYTQDYIVRRINELRNQHENLGNVAEQIVEECLRCDGVSRPCYDNVTLIIVSLGEYLMDYEKRSLMNTPQQLQLRKQSSVGHCPCDTSGFTSKQNELAIECHSLLQLSNSQGECFSDGNASQVSTNVNVNPFLVSSNPSSQTSSPQQFCNPKSDNLHVPAATETDSGMANM